MISGECIRMLTMIDEYTRECLAIRVARRLGSYEVIEALADVMLWRGVPENIRSDNGPEFVAGELRKWLGNLGTGTLYIEPGSQAWEQRCTARASTESLREECLNGEIFYRSLLREAQIVIEKWRVEFTVTQGGRIRRSATGRQGTPAACRHVLWLHRRNASSQAQWSHRTCDVNSFSSVLVQKLGLVTRHIVYVRLE